MDKKLHLGCFDQVVPGWVNTDVTPHLFVARVPGLAYLLHRVRILSDVRYQQHKNRIFRQVRYLNVTKRVPFADDSVRYVYAAHLLEHLYPEQAPYCVSEIHRVLRPTGIVRLAVPDLDLMIDSFDQSNPNQFLEADQKRDKNRHHSHYNEASLSRMLTDEGFRDVRGRDYRDGRCPDLELLDNRPEITLFVEAMN